MHDILTTAAMLGAGLVAGIFFAFSTFVMRALGRLRPTEGIAAMQAINVTVINPFFLVAFFGTGALCVFLAFRGALAASAFYVVGCLLVTMVFNVPLNNRLASVEPGDAGVLWTHYLARWTLWNHVRTAASFVAAGLFAAAL